MIRPAASSLLVLLLGASLFAQVVTKPGRPVNPAASPAEPPPPVAPLPDPPPLPPDVRSPDAPPGSPAGSGNAVSRTLKRLAPNCINAIFHACWSSPPERPQPPQTDVRKGVASREVAEFYMERGNYRAAESRLREALGYNPIDARAMSDLAESLEKQNLLDGAVEEYRSCQSADPAGTYGERCRKRLDLVSAKTTSAPHP